MDAVPQGGSVHRISSPNVVAQDGRGNGAHRVLDSRMTELDVSIDAALVPLDRAATEAALHDDPLQLPFAALASFLRAQKALYVDGAASLAQHLEQARQPVRDEELQKAVVRGIRPHAVAIVQAINWRTAAYLVMTALCI